MAQVPLHLRKELLIKGGLDPAHLLNIKLVYEVRSATIAQ